MVGVSLVSQFGPTTVLQDVKNIHQYLAIYIIKNLLNGKIQNLPSWFKILPNPKFYYMISTNQ